MEVGQGHHVHQELETVSINELLHIALPTGWGVGWGQHEKLNAYCFVSTQLDTKDVTLTLPLPLPHPPCGT